MVGHQKVSRWRNCTILNYIRGSAKARFEEYQIYSTYCCSNIHFLEWGDAYAWLE
jgi:hypothetical protein